MSQTKTSFACASLLGVLLASQPNAAWGTVTVCSSSCDQESIQAGIDQAVADSDDTVLVSPGTYVENITMAAGVTVKSEGGNDFIPYTDPFVRDAKFPLTLNEKQVVERATQTIIQGSGNATVVSFPTGTDNAVLDGFIVENIDDTALGIPLIMVEDCSPTIQYTIVRDNQGQGQSGGIEVVGGATDVATPLIQDNVIHYVNGHGIGVYSKSAPTIIDNEIFTTPPVVLDSNPSPQQHEAYRAAPGIGFHVDSAGTVLYNHIFYSGAAGIGSRGAGAELGGVYDLPGYGFDIRGNTIHHNYAGAGIGMVGEADLVYSTSGVDITIGGPDPGDAVHPQGDRNTIYNNYIGLYIGLNDNGVSKSLGTVIIQRNTIHDNLQPGMSVNHTTVAEITENTVEYNWKPGIHVNRNADLTIEGNTLTGNGHGALNMGAGIWMQNNDLAHTVLVQNNTITSGKSGGIDVRGGEMKADIQNNTITSNLRGGIRIVSATELNIFDNEIAENGRGGMHTGTFKDDGAGTVGGSIYMQIIGNKVHNNGIGDLGAGAGIDVRHADGIIENNLVYGNATAGIRFGDWIDAINHNTVVNNGAPGIVYDDLAGSVMGPMSGFPPLPIPIKNNILVGNSVFGMNPGTAPPWPEETVCDACQCEHWFDYRDFNLVSANGGKPASDDDPYWEETYGCAVMIGDTCVSLAEPMAIAGFTSQLGMCGPYSSMDPNIRNGEIYKLPSFVDADNDDYHLQATSLAVGAGEGGVDMGAYGGPNAIDW